ncbi:MAG: hypothetical protein RR942_13630 [Romboutsia sp.]
MQKILLVMLTLPLSLALMGFSKEPTNYEEERVDKSYYMPLEDEEHEGTWIQWPHSYTYGRAYQRGIEDIWVKMTKALTKVKKFIL